MTLRENVLRVLRSEDRDWRLAEITQGTGASVDAVSTTLWQLKRFGQVQRVSRGVYRVSSMSVSPAPASSESRVARTGAGKIQYRVAKGGVRTSLPPDYPLPKRSPSIQTTPRISTLSTVPKYEERGLSGWNSTDYRVSAATKPLAYPKIVELFADLAERRRACWLAVVSAQAVIVSVLRHVEDKDTVVPARLLDLALVTDSMGGRHEISTWLFDHDPTMVKLREILTVIRGSKTDPQWLPQLVQDRDFGSWRRACANALRHYDDLRGQIAAANLGLAMRAARKLAGRGGYMFEDLVNEGFTGLLSAVDRFRHDRNLRFSTYAVHWIRHSLNRAIENNGRVVRLPVHLQVHNVHMLRVRESLGEDVHAIAAELKVSPKTVQRLIREQAVFVPHASLSTPVFGEEGTELVDLLQDTTEDPFTNVERAESSALLEMVLAELSDADRQLLEWRFGIDGEPRTLDMIGRDLGLCRERVRQLQNHVLEKLRRIVTRHEVRAFLSKVPDIQVTDEPEEEPTIPPDYRQRVVDFFARHADPSQGWATTVIARATMLRGYQVRQICHALVAEGLLRIKHRKYWGLLHKDHLEQLIMQSLDVTPKTPGELGMHLGIQRAVVARTLHQMATAGRIFGTRRSYSLLAPDAAAAL